MAIAIRNEGSKLSASINVTPLVDVMLVLLIIFMVVTPLLQNRGPLVKLAETSNPVAMPDADREDAILVAVNRDGVVFFNVEPVAVEKLAEKIANRTAGRADKRVFVKADARANYGSVVRVVDQIRTAGVDELALLTEQRGPAMLEQ